MARKKLSIKIEGNNDEEKQKTNAYHYGRKASVFITNQFNKARLGMGEKINFWLYKQMSKLSKKWFTHLFLSIVLLIYTIGGALIFLTIEGKNETDVVRKKIHVEMRELLKDFRVRAKLYAEDSSIQEWNAEAVRMILKFEDMICGLYDKHPLVVSNAADRTWNIYNSVVYCATLYSTIGYGHLYPTTFTGRVLTIGYSLIGIPLFLIVLTDFGKLFTNAIKFIWSFVRRLYYTGSCRKARKTTKVEEIIKGAQIIYEVATLRRPSLFSEAEKNNEKTSEEEKINETEDKHETTTENETELEDTTLVVDEQSPMADLQSPDISNFEIDEEFNLPISVALVILVIYIFLGALIYMYGEGWDFFSSFYFVFISMSTVGFGDLVPANPICMIGSIIYLCFGLAFMTMCINVVQDKMSDTFSHASKKMGLDANQDTPGAQDTVSLTPVTAFIVDETDLKKDGDKQENQNTA